MLKRIVQAIRLWFNPPPVFDDDLHVTTYDSGAKAWVCRCDQYMELVMEAWPNKDEKLTRV